jgi:hypothetical protein
VSEGYWALEGMTWSPAGEEIYFSGGDPGGTFVPYAVTPDGKRRALVQAPGGLTFLDADKGGRWLMTRNDQSRGVMARAAGEQAERDVSWLNQSIPVALSTDGKVILMDDESVLAGPNYSVSIRGTDGSPVVRLGEGLAADLSRDGKWALAIIPSTPPKLVLYSTGAGETRHLDRGNIEFYGSASLFPDNKSILSCGSEPGHPSRCYLQEIAGGASRPLTPPGFDVALASPDGKLLAARGGEGRWALIPVAGGEPRELPSITSDDFVAGWSSDGRFILVYRRTQIPTSLERVDPDSGRREPFLRIDPQEKAGLISMGPMVLSADERSYAYGFLRYTSQLYLVETAR